MMRKTIQVKTRSIDVQNFDARNIWNVVTGVEFASNLFTWQSYGLLDLGGIPAGEEFSFQSLLRFLKLVEYVTVRDSGQYYKRKMKGRINILKIDVFPVKVIKLKSQNSKYCKHSHDTDID